MSLYKNNPVTLPELEQWKKNKFINPRSNRKIKISSPIFKYLDEENNKRNAQYLSIIDDEIIIDEDNLHIICEDGTDISKVEDGTDISKVEDGTDISKVEDGTDISKVEDGTDISKVEDGTDISKVEDGTDISKGINRENKNIIDNNTSMNITIKNDNHKILNLLKDIQGPLEGNYINSFDNKDPVSQEDIWIFDKGKKIISDEIPLYKMFSYRDNDGNIRCFNIESIQTMINSNMNKHPITCEVIEDCIIERANKMIKILIDNNILKINIEDDNLTKIKIKNYAFDVFQKFSFISIFVDSEWFLKLQLQELTKLNYELKDFYENNVDINSRKIMVPPDGIAFELSNESLISKTNNNILEIQQYILNNIEKVIGTTEDDAMKNLGNYIMIGGLAVVCPEIRESYPDIVYGFSF